MVDYMHSNSEKDRMRLSRSGRESGGQAIRILQVVRQRDNKPWG